MKRGWILFFVVVILVIVALIPYKAIILFVAELLPLDLSDFPWDITLRLFLWIVASLPIIYFGGNMIRDERTRNSFLLLLVVMSLVVILLLPAALLSIVWEPTLKVSLWPMVAFLLIYYVLAPDNIFFTLVKEGTAKIVVKGDEFDTCLIQWKGYTFSSSETHPEKWKVIPESESDKEPWHPFGGLRIYGAWPLKDILELRLRWTTVAEDGQEKTRDEWMDYVLLQDDVYLAKISKAEDQKLLPLDIQLYLTVRVENPYKAAYRIQDWLEAIINRIQPLVRQFVATKKYNELGLQKQAAAEEMMQHFREAGLLGEDGVFQRDYGVEVKTVEFRTIDPPDTWREVTLKVYTAEQNAEANMTEGVGLKMKTILEAEGLKEKLSMIGDEFKNLKGEDKDAVLYSLISELTSGKDAPGILLLHKLSTRLAQADTDNSLDKIAQALQGLLEGIQET